MPPAVVARDLYKSYGSLEAVRGISFEVEEGECFGFLGPNGAGKTTTIRMLHCASPVERGELRILGLDAREEARRIKDMEGVVPQETNLDPDFTVLKNLLVYARYFDIPKDEALRRSEELLKFVELREKREVYISELSGGMKRRLLIARALLNKPRLLILDEPTTGLDPQARHLIWDRLRALKGQGVTLILTTHYMEEAEQLCDRLVIMNEGKVLERGTPRELVQRFIGADVLEVEGSDGIEDYLNHEGLVFERLSGRWVVYTKEPRLTEERLAEKFKLDRTIARRATLEDVFLKLTGRELRE